MGHVTGSSRRGSGWRTRAPLLALVVTLASPAQGQTAPAEPQAASAADASPEIVVTARRREERLLDVPVTVNVMGGEALERSQITRLDTLSQAVPQLTIAKTGAGTGANVQIRGIGSMANDPGVQSLVAINVDGIQVSNARSMLVAGLFDLKSLEVLKGPQALFFGKNSPGGVISLISNSPVPGHDMEGFVRAGYNFLERGRFVEGAVSIPVSDTFAARIALHWDDSRGYILNEATTRPDVVYVGPGGTRPFTAYPADRRAPGSGNWIGRLTLVWQPSDSFDAKYKLFASRYTDNGAASSRVILGCPGGAIRPVTVTTPRVADPTGDCVGDDRRSVSMLDPRIVAETPRASDHLFSRIDTIVQSLELVYDSDNFSLTSTTGHFRSRFTGFDDYDYTSTNYIFRADDELTRTISQELRLETKFDGPLNLTVGAFYENLDRYSKPALWAFPFGPDPATGRYDSYEILQKTKGDTYSAFGELSWAIVPELKFTAGARFTREEKSQDAGNIYVASFGAAALAPVTRRYIDKLASDNLSPEFTLTYTPTPSLTFFGAYKTGYLSPGFSNPGTLLASATEASLRFDKATARGGEIGFKSSLEGGRLRIDGTVFRYDYQDLQLTSFNAVTLAYTTLNAAGARTEGAELVASYQLSSELSLSGWLGYNKSRFKSFPNAQCFATQTVAQGCVGGRQDLSGKRVGSTPDFAANLGFRYLKPIGGDWSFSLAGDATYNGKFNPTAAGSNYRDYLVEDEHVMLNASIGFETEAYSIALTGRNLSNRRFIAYAADSSGTAAGTFSGFLNRPREVVLEGKVKF